MGGGGVLSLLCPSERGGAPEGSRQESLSSHGYFAAFIKNINIKHSLTHPTRPSAGKMFIVGTVTGEQGQKERLTKEPTGNQKKKTQRKWI